MRHYAAKRKEDGSITSEAITILNWSKPSSLTLALGSSRVKIEMSTRNLPGDDGLSARKAENFTATACIKSRCLSTNIQSLFFLSPNFRSKIPDLSCL
jgi:hypothetical protein